MTMLTRVVGVWRLDPLVFEDVERDPRAGWQAGLVVVASSLAAGVGLGGLPSAPRSVVTTSVAALLAWVAWALVVYVIGVKLMPTAATRSNWGELARTTGFATAPGLFRVAFALPVPPAVVFALVSAWMLAAMIIAVRQALDYTSALRAFVVCLVGWLLSTALVMAWGFVAGTTVF
ncbi:MAG: hypothetical protein U0Q12_26510 [Vicinamibacterales bacterium]